MLGNRNTTPKKNSFYWCGVSASINAEKKIIGAAQWVHKIQKKNIDTCIDHHSVDNKNYQKNFKLFLLCQPPGHWHLIKHIFFYPDNTRILKNTIDRIHTSADHCSVGTIFFFNLSSNHQAMIVKILTWVSTIGCRHRCALLFLSDHTRNYFWTWIVLVNTKIFGLIW